MCEVGEGVSDDFELPRVLYTGTGREYLGQTLEVLGEFRHLGKEVYLDESLFNACGYALQRAKFYDDSPVLMVVDSQKLKGEVRYDGRYKAKALPLGSFIPYEISPDVHGKLQEADYDAILNIKDLVTTASQEDIERKVARFLASRC